jgi:DNA polymerase V
MKNAGIREADLLVVDKSKTVSHNKIVVAELNNSLLVKRYKNENGRVSLSPENGAYDEILINENDNFSIWGVVTSVIRALS